MFDPNNPDFPRQLRSARNAALRFADKVNDAEGHMRSLELLSAGLADGHARAQASYSGEGDILWPGFRTVWRGNALYVVEPLANRPPRGSILVGCDGKDARTIIRESLWFYGRPAEAGQWWINAGRTFERVKSPYETLPRHCQFRRPDGRTIGYALDWQPVPRALLRAWFEVGSKREPVALTEPRTGLYLITLSTFSPDVEGRAQYKRLFQDIGDNFAKIASARALIIDLRLNAGGSSTWSESIAGKLWGEAAVASKLARYFRKTQIRWLADQPNIAHFRQAATRLRSEGRSEVAQEIEEIAQHLVEARNQGKRFYIEDFGASLAAKAQSSTPRPLPPVYVIVDGGCGSACLDAVDTFTQFAGVKLVGAPTSADSNYLEIRFNRLPSGRGIVVLPTKIWVNRPRRAGEVYRPDIPVNDLDWTTATMLEHIERDLAAGITKSR